MGREWRGGGEWTSLAKFQEKEHGERTEFLVNFSTAKGEEINKTEKIIPIVFNCPYK